MQQVDIAIIGAGWHGLSMAKTWVEVNPDTRMVIIDSAASVGGTWAKERLYPGLKTNNLLGSYEFSDFPMTSDRFGVWPGQHIPGTVVHEYLTQAAEHFGLVPYMCLQRQVLSAELVSTGEWRLQLESVSLEQSKSDRETIFAAKLVVATGLTSEPFLPIFTGQEKFGGDIFHAKDLGHRVQCVTESSKVIVLGGNKSAWDTCYFAAKTGAQVHMVIRLGGGGPSWVWPVALSPFKVSIQRIAATRAFTWFDPGIWGERSGPVGWIRRFLHKTLLGRYLVSKFWGILESLACKAFVYDEHPETTKLKPWVSPFWMGNSLSIHNYAYPWFDLVREGRIKVHIADVTALSKGQVLLSNGERIEANVFICCTGWRTQPSFQFLPNKLAIDLTRVGNANEDGGLMNRAHLEIFGEAPALKQQPTRTLPPGIQDPVAEHGRISQRTHNRYMLYRFMVPGDLNAVGGRNIAFIGVHLALTAVVIAQLQSLWITAYLMDEIPHLAPSRADYDKVRYETILHNEYTRIRHPHMAGGIGDRCPDLTFDCLAYTDLLQDDLSLPKYRKAGLWQEIFHRYTPADFVGIVQQWLNSRHRYATSK